MTITYLPYFLAHIVKNALPWTQSDHFLQFSNDCNQSSVGIFYLGKIGRFQTVLLLLGQSW